MPQPPDYAQPYDDGSSIPDYAQPYDEVGYTGSPYQGSKDVLSSLYDWIGNEYEQVKKNAAAAQTDLTAGDYPKAFYDIGSPLIDLWKQSFGTLGKDISTYQSDIPGSGGFQVPQDPAEARKAGAQQAFGLAGIPVEKFQQAWEAKDYPRMAGQGVTAAALLLAPHALGKIRLGGEPRFGSEDAWQGPPSNPALRFGVPSPPEEAIPPTPVSAGIEARFNQKLPAGTDLGFNPETVQEPHLPFTVPDYAQPYESTTPAAPQGPGQIGLPLEGTSYEEGQATPQTPRYPPGTPLEQLPATITLQEPTKLKIEQQRQRGYVPLEENEDGSLRLIRKDLATETSQSAPPSGESVDALRQRLADVLSRQETEGETAPTQERPNIVVAKTSADIDRWLAQGYKIINQRSPDNYIQMIPGDAVAPEANTPVQAAGEKIAVNANGELPIPDDKLTVKFQKKLESKGWTLSRAVEGINYFIKNEQGSLDLGALRDGLRRLLGREPTEQEVQREAEQPSRPINFINPQGERVDQTGRPLTPNEIAVRQIFDRNILGLLMHTWEAELESSRNIGDTQGVDHAQRMLQAIEEQRQLPPGTTPIEPTVVSPTEPSSPRLTTFINSNGDRIDHATGRIVTPNEVEIRHATDPQYLDALKTYWESNLNFANQIGDNQGRDHATQMLHVIDEQRQSLLTSPTWPTIETTHVDTPAPEPRAGGYRSQYTSLYDIGRDLRELGNVEPGDPRIAELVAEAEQKIASAQDIQDASDNALDISSAYRYAHIQDSAILEAFTQLRESADRKIRQLRNPQVGPSFEQQPIPSIPQPTQQELPMSLQLRQQNQLENIGQAGNRLSETDITKWFSDLEKQPKLPLSLKTGLTRARYEQMLASMDPHNYSPTLDFSYARQELQDIPIDKYKAGIWVNDLYPTYSEPHKQYDITYRDAQGNPLAHASSVGDKVLSLVSDENGGIASHRAVVKVLFKLLDKDVFKVSGPYSRYTKNLIEGLARFVEDDSASSNSQAALDEVKRIVNESGFIRRLGGETGAVTIPSWEGIKRTIESAKQKTGIGMGETKPVATDDPGARYIDEVLGLTKSAMATGDLSAFRQTLAHAFTKDFWKGQYKGVRSALSPEYDKAVDMEIKSKPIFQDHVDAEGNDIPAYNKQIGYKLLSDKKLSTRAEQIASNWLENGQFFGVPDNPVSRLWSRTYGDLIARPSERAYRTTLNYIGANRLEYLLDRAKDMSNDAALTGSARVGAMDQILRTKTKFTPEEAASMNPYTNLVLGREISDFVRTSIGQAPLKFYAAPFRQAEVNVESAAKLLTRSLFAPRSLFSKFRMLNPNTYIMASPFVRMQYMKAALATTAAWIGMAKMAQMAGADVTWNPINADFGKVRFGNTRLDFGQGYTPFLVSAFRLFTGQYTSSATKQTHEYGAGYNAPTQFDQLGRTIVGNKLEPFVAFSRDILAASDYQPFQVLDRTGQLFIAMSAQDTYDILRTNPKMLPFLVPPIVLGFSSQTYDSGKQKPKFIAPGHDIVVKRPALKKLIPGMSHH